MGNRYILACLLCVAGCAPVTTSRRILETPRDGGLQRDPPQKGEIELRVVASADRYLVTSSDALTCIERRVTIVKRVERTRKSVNKPITVIEYVLGLGIGAAGGIAIVDPDLVLDQTGWGETPRNDLNRENMQKAGAGAAGVGALFLTFGIINSFRGGSSERGLPDESRPSATGSSVACGTAPRNGDEIVLSIENKRWPLGKTDNEGKLAIPWSSIGADHFDGAWRSAVVTASSASATIDLSPVRDALAEREWTALVAAPTLDGARRFQTRFAGIHDAELKPLIVQLADQAHAPVMVAALARADLAQAKQALVVWKQDAPGSALAAAQETEIGELERRGRADYLYVKYEAAIAGADADPKKLDDAERTLAVLLEVAPADPRLAAAQKATSKKRETVMAANVKLATKHAGQARSHARHGELAKAEAALAIAVKLAPNHKDVISSVQYVENFKAKAAAREPAKTTDDKVKLAAEARAKADEERAEQQRLAAAAKALADSERAARREQERAEQARIATEVKAKRDAERAERAARARAAADAERARIAEENAKADEARARSADEKAKAREETRKATAERARLAAEARARERAEAARATELARVERAELARVEKAKAELARIEKAKLAEAARVATVEKARVSGRRGGSDAAVVAPGAVSDVVGLWASMIGSDAVWLVELRANGGGRTAVWMDGRLIGFRAIDWRIDGDVLALTAGASSMHSPVRADAGQLSWAGVHWKRQ